MGGRIEAGSSPLGQRRGFWGVDRAALCAEHHRTPTGGEAASRSVCVCSETRPTSICCPRNAGLNSEQGLEWIGELWSKKKKKKTKSAIHIWTLSTSLCWYLSVQLMVVVSDAGLTELHRQMPAAVLQSPAPAGPDWSFQNPVGVDCSSPEPRCIWVAVLRGTSDPLAPTMPAEHGQSFHHLRVRGGLLIFII